MPDNPLDFTGKVVLVTGGSTGIGRATALAFGRTGAKVVVGDVSDAGAETVDLLKREGGDGLFVRTNVASADEVERLVATTVRSYGGLHCAFNNAGVLPPTLPLAEQDEATFDKVIAVDLKGVFLCLSTRSATWPGSAAAPSSTPPRSQG
jgi:NAD(P)-dependent dehydrogenase (short-subunit alcohol dehydrogenase family)